MSRFDQWYFERMQKSDDFEHRIVPFRFCSHLQEKIVNHVTMFKWRTRLSSSLFISLLSYDYIIQ